MIERRFQAEIAKRRAGQSELCPLQTAQRQRGDSAEACMCNESAPHPHIVNGLVKAHCTVRYSCA